VGTKTKKRKHNSKLNKALASKKKDVGGGGTINKNKKWPGKRKTKPLCQLGGTTVFCRTESRLKGTSRKKGCGQWRGNR